MEFLKETIETENSQEISFIKRPFYLDSDEKEGPIQEDAVFRLSNMVKALFLVSTVKGV